MNFYNQIHDFLLTGSLLPGIRDFPVDNSFHVIFDFDEALILPMSSNLSYQISENLKTNDYSWNNIRENELSEMYKILWDENKMDDYNTRINNIDIFKILDSKLPSEFKEIIDAVDYDFAALLACGEVCPEGNEFYRQLFKVYFEGGWPCGWNDDTNRIIGFFNIVES